MPKRCHHCKSHDHLIADCHLLDERFKYKKSLAKQQNQLKDGQLEQTDDQAAITTPDEKIHDGDVTGQQLNGSDGGKPEMHSDQSQVGITHHPCSGSYSSASSHADGSEADSHPYSDSGVGVEAVPGTRSGSAGCGNGCGGSDTYSEETCHSN